MWTAPSQAAQALSAMSFSLYSQLAPGREGHNLFFSPANICTTLTMLSLGARGETQSQIRHVLDGGGGDFNEVLATSFLKGLARGQRDVRSGADDRIQLRMANSLWIDGSFAVKEGISEKLEREFGAKLATVNFRGNPREAYEAINQYIERATEGMIRDLLQPDGEVDPLMRMVLASAIYFKGEWETCFSALDTKPSDFTLINGNRKTVPMMRQENKKYPLHVDYKNGIKVLELPYQGGVSMIVVLPNDYRGLEPLEQGITSDSLNRWLRKMYPSPVNLAFPRFAFESEFELSAALKKLGMEIPFKDFEADFTGFGEGTTPSNSLVVDRIAHKAKVKVTEEGTTAAAATGSRMRVTLGAPPQPEEFHADHPFLFLIRDQKTGAILFMGRVMDP